MTSDELREALRDTVSAEYAAAYAYGVVGARSRGAARVRARRAADWHLAQQSSLRAQLTDAGAAVPLPAPAYTLPGAATSASAMAALAATVEDRVAAVYANLVAAATGAARGTAAQALAACAVRAAQWRGSSSPFPGVPERSARP